METDDPSTPLLGNVPRNRFRNAVSTLCSVESWKRRLPVTIWLPKYNCECFIRDAIAGITVGLTSIPQGIAYAIIAGLPPQVGLYSSIFPGIAYALFGSCKDVTVGPTAILAALLAKYVAKSPDFAYLASFLSGCVILLLGVLQLGFLLDFISKPVISAFTTAAALQISASQLKSLFRIKGSYRVIGSSGDTFIEAVINFFRNITTIQLWDTLLGVVSIIALLLLKRVSVGASESRVRAVASRACQYVIRARNALVVFVGALTAYCLQVNGITPFALTGKIEGGLPHFAPPPFSTTVDNRTLSFEDMVSEYGPEGLVMPLVAVLESIAIAKAFAGSKTVDATQEMIAIGVANVFSSFCQSMPATGSFTRTALNHASGVMTPAGSLVKASLVLLSVTLLADAFYFIPRATLAAVIIVAMCSIIEFTIVRTLWRNSKVELAVWVVTVVAGAGVGLEYGILCGALADAGRALARSGGPPLHTAVFKVGNIDCITLTFLGPLSFASASRIQTALHQAARDTGRSVVAVDGKYWGELDLGVAENLITTMLELETLGHRCLLWNVSDRHRALLTDIHADIALRCVHGTTIDQYVLGIEPPLL